MAMVAFVLARILSPTADVYLIRLLAHLTSASFLVVQSAMAQSYALHEVVGPTPPTFFRNVGLSIKLPLPEVALCLIVRLFRKIPLFMAPRDMAYPMWDALEGFSSIDSFDF